jgi:hypothetical protein
MEEGGKPQMAQISQRGVRNVRRLFARRTLSTPKLGGLVPRRGSGTQPRVSTMETVSPLRRALKGLQIAPVMPPISRIAISGPNLSVPLISEIGAICGLTSPADFRAINHSIWLTSGDDPLI